MGSGKFLGEVLGEMRDAGLGCVWVWEFGSMWEGESFLESSLLSRVQGSGF